MVQYKMVQYIVLGCTNANVTETQCKTITTLKMFDSLQVKALYIMLII